MPNRGARGFLAGAFDRPSGGAEAAQLESAGAQARGGGDEGVKGGARDRSAVGPDAVDGVGDHHVDQRGGGGEGDPLKPAVVGRRERGDRAGEDRDSDDAVDGLKGVIGGWDALKGRDEEGARLQGRYRQTREDFLGYREGGPAHVRRARGVPEQGIGLEGREEAGGALGGDDNRDDEGADESPHRGGGKVHDGARGNCGLKHGRREAEAGGRRRPS